MDRLKERPKREEVEALVPQDVESVRDLIISAFPGGRREEAIWGYLTSIAAERLPSPLVVQPRNYAGLELRRGKLDPGRRAAGLHRGGRRVLGGGPTTWGREDVRGGSSSWVALATIWGRR